MEKDTEENQYLHLQYRMLDPYSQILQGGSSHPALFYPTITPGICRTFRQIRVDKDWVIKNGTRPKI